MCDKKCLAPAQDGWDGKEIAEANARVEKLQKRIRTALKEQEYDKAEHLIHRLTHSWSARVIAVHTVCTNRGKNTPGIDNVIWNTPQDKYDAVAALRFRGYHSWPCRRVYIEKGQGDGSLRPLSIPTMRDRAMQALVALALAPVEMEWGDKHSYAYRKKYNAAKAIKRAIEVLSCEESPSWILEADIKSCFDNIDHGWIMEHIPVHKDVLHQFITAGYVENGEYHVPSKGISQGGPISPVIANCVLNGIEGVLHTYLGASVNLIRYADDFIVIGTDGKALKEVAKPVIEEFLAERGLHLSEKKTRITRIEDGFDFLGWNVRKVGEDILAVPSTHNVDKLRRNIAKIMSKKELSAEQRHERLRQSVTAWLGYHKDVVRPIDLFPVCQDTVLWIASVYRDTEAANIICNIFSTV